MKQTQRYRWFVAVALLCAVLALSSCAFLEKRSSLRTANDTYATVMNALSALQDADLISAEAAERIDTARLAASAALDAWQEALETDQPTSAIIARFTETIVILIEERLAAQKGSDD